MSEPPLQPTFPPRRGLTEGEKRKVEAWEKAGKIKQCPAVGSPELLALGVAKYREWLAKVGMAMKVKLGLVPVQRPERTEKERRKRKKAQEKEWHRKRKEERQK